MRTYPMTERETRLLKNSPTIRKIVERGNIYGSDIMPALIELMKDFNQESETWEQFCKDAREGYSVLIGNLDIVIRPGVFWERRDEFIVPLRFTFASTGEHADWCWFYVMGECEIEIGGEWSEKDAQFKKFSMLCE